MPLDPEYLRQHYASLSDEALLATDRADLVAMAQKIFDDEVRQRRLPPVGGAHAVSRQPDPPDDEAELDEAEFDGETPDPGDQSEWLEDAAEVCSFAVLQGAAEAPDAALNARETLDAAGIPCHLDLCEIPPEKSLTPYGTHRWRLMVPGKLNWHAASVMERDISNPEFEEVWRTYLETLSNKELRAMPPEVAFCGLFDRIERVNRVYNEELKSRKLK